MLIWTHEIHHGMQRAATDCLVIQRVHSAFPDPSDHVKTMMKRGAVAVSIDPVSTVQPELPLTVNYKPGDFVKFSGGHRRLQPDGSPRQHAGPPLRSVELQCLPSCDSRRTQNK